MFFKYLLCRKRYRLIQIHVMYTNMYNMTKWIVFLKLYDKNNKLRKNYIHCSEAELNIFLILLKPETTKVP